MRASSFRALSAALQLTHRRAPSQASDEGRRRRQGAVSRPRPHLRRCVHSAPPCSQPVSSLTELYHNTGVAPYVAFNFASYELLKLQISGLDPQHRPPNTFEKLVCGGVAGGISQTVRSTETADLFLLGGV